MKNKVNSKEQLSKLFENVTDVFNQHLETDENERILFSGIYGIGKTTFLKHFFEKNKGKYNAIHLYPINYSVLQNEDIFSYLKYDILYELIVTHKVQLEYKNFSLAEKSYFWGKENAVKIFQAFLLLIPKMGKQLFQFSEILEQFYQSFKKFSKNAEKEEENKLKAFLSEFQLEGEMYESNVITELAKVLLEQLKNNEEKENILIIDDIDRIDPQHVFRLFNVFSAHFDIRGKGEPNKFGFDKVIFVCDIQNIRNLFQYRYGGEVDFNGYIDKFYSREIFYYDNRTNIQSIISQIINGINLIPDNKKMQDSLRGRGGCVKNLLEKILTDAIIANRVNLRNLLKYGNIEMKTRRINIDKNIQIVNYGYYTTLLLEILKSYLGDLKDIIKTVELLNNAPSRYIEVAVFDELIFFADTESHKFTEGDYTFTQGDVQKDYSLNISYQDHYSLNHYHVTSNGQEKLDFYQLFVKALEALEKMDNSF